MKRKFEDVGLGSGKSLRACFTLLPFLFKPDGIKNNHRIMYNVMKLILSEGALNHTALRNQPTSDVVPGNGWKLTYPPGRHVSITADWSWCHYWLLLPHLTWKWTLIVPFIIENKGQISVVVCWFSVQRERKIRRPSPCRSCSLYLLSNPALAHATPFEQAVVIRLFQILNHPVS